MKVIERTPKSLINISSIERSGREGVEGGLINEGDPPYVETIFYKHAI